MDLVFLTAEQIAEQLQLHPRTVRRMLAAGQLPGVKIGAKEWRTSAQSLLEFVEGRLAADEIQAFCDSNRQ